MRASRAVKESSHHPFNQSLAGIQQLFGRCEWGCGAVCYGASGACPACRYAGFQNLARLGSYARRYKSLRWGTDLKQSKCPSCGRTLTWRTIRYGSSFRCPGCGKELCISWLYSKLSFLAAQVLSFGTAYFLVGFRDFELYITIVLVLLLPFVALTNYVGVLLVPPSPRLYYPDYLSLDFMHGAPRHGDETGKDGPPEAHSP